MVYKVDEVKRDVRIAMDENKSVVQFLKEKDFETLSLDDIIGSKVVEAVRRVEGSAPAFFLEEGHLFGDAVYWMGEGRGWTLLPDDFMRLVAFRMSDWERTCFAAITPDDPLYDLQWSRFRGVRGNVQKPVCAVVNRAEGKALEFFSCNSEDATVQRASYIPFPAIDGDGGIDICERCYTPVVYMTAALALTALGEHERSAQFASLAKSIFDV